MPPHSKLAGKLLYPFPAMPSDDLPPNDVATVAPRRAAPLKAPPPPPPVDPATLAAARAIARANRLSSAAPVAPAPALARSALETKIAAAGHDADQILLTLNTEMALRRAGRSVRGPGQVQALRVLSMVMLFVLFVAALGAMYYLQTQLAGHGYSHRPAPTAPATTASPAPDPSAPAVGPAHQSVPPKH